MHLLIFDEMGLKVYENEHYGKNGDYFRGYANAKGFIGNSKALHGTYFYIVRYSKRGKKEQQKGFLYVR
nr:gliding motility-associated C-terminal domain-containing protein [Capnocytophaga ochracea]